MDNQETFQTNPSGAGSVRVVESSKGAGLKITLVVVGMVALIFLALTAVFWVRSRALDSRVNELEYLNAMYDEQLKGFTQEEESSDAPNGVFQDDDLSFEYPSSVFIKKRDAMEGGVSRTLEFLVRDQDETLLFTGYALQYPHVLDDVRDGAATFDELVAYWTAPERIFPHETGTVAGRTFLKIQPGGLAGDDVMYYIQGDEPDSVLVIDGAFLYEPHAELVLLTLLETLTVY